MALAGNVRRDGAARRPAVALALLFSAACSLCGLLRTVGFVGTSPAAAPRGSLVARRADIIQVPGGMKNGLKLLIDGSPYQVMSFLSKKQGKGVAITKTKVKDLFTGALSDKTLASGSKYEVIDTEWVEATYSYYNEGDNTYVFMDTENFEEMEMKSDLIGPAAEWLTEGGIIEVEQYDGRQIQIRFKDDVIVKVESIVDTGRKDGNVVALLENGLKKQGPGYLKEGDKVLISQDNWEIKKRM